MNFYVSVKGCDDNKGTKNEPFATLEQARNTIREKFKTGLTEPITVYVGKGEYSVRHFMLDVRDSGTESCPITYVADGEVILNGGMMLNADLFEPLLEEEVQRLHGDAREKVVRIDLKKLGISRKDYGEMCITGSHHTGNNYDDVVLSPLGCELFVNDIRQTVARYPNEGFLFTEEPIREGDGLESSITGKIIYRYTLEEWAEKRNPLSDLHKLDEETSNRVASWKSLSDVWIYGYPRWNWADMSSPILSFDHATRALEPKLVSRYGMKSQAPYYFYNVFEELDIPGEWYLNRDTGILYLYPNVDLSEANVMLSLLTESVMDIQNVSHFTLNGFTFTGTRSDALTVSGDHILIENCTVKNVAGNAMVINGHDILVRNCEIHHVGRGGIRTNGGDRNTLTPSHIVVENNHIHHYAEIFRTYEAAVELKGVGTVCRNNLIHDASHLAIYFEGNEHLIEYNEIHDVCKTADDSSAIYSGRDYTTQGNVIHRNYFHDLKSEVSRDVGVFAMYCDDNLGKCTITQNVFERCQSALLLHGGHNMTFTGNVILDACPKSKESVYFGKYHFWDDLLPGGIHIKRLQEVPWQSEIWKKAYPQIEKYLEWDPETEQRFPHYGNISGNVIINHKPIEINFDWADERFENRVENNVYIDNRPEFELAELCETVLPTTIDSFEPIPFKKIGIQTKK